MPAGLNPVCVDCQEEMRCVLNGVAVKTYGIWFRGDAFQCPNCGAEIVTQFGQPMDIQKHPIPSCDVVISLDKKPHIPEIL